MTGGVDTLVNGGRIWSDGSLVEGIDAVAIAAGVIVAIGRAAEIESLAGPRTRRLNAHGATVTPGLVDSHIHLVTWARSLTELRLEGTGTREAVLDAVAAFLTSHPGTSTVVGRGWAADGWAQPPDRAALDSLARDRPLLLHSRDFHSLWVNGTALDRAGVTRSTPDPPGGRFERDGAGEPTGIVREHAIRLFGGLLSNPDPDRDLGAVREAVRLLHAEGITGVHDFEGPAEQPVLRRMTGGEGPRVRVLSHLSGAGLEPALALGLEPGLGDDWLRLGSVKLFADGTLGSRTAALLEPYEGTAESGMDLLSPAELRALVLRASGGGWSVAIHAIGDRAVRSALDALEAAAVAARRPAVAPRIEHLQLVHPDDLGRFATLGVAASMQPVHCTSDIELAERYWRTRLDRAYAWRSVSTAGALLAFGSDAPVEWPSAAHGLHAAVTRRRRDGSPPAGFVPRERISLDAALRAYTENPSRLAGTWPRVGRLGPGSAADLVIWNADLHRTPPQDLHAVEPQITMLAGEVVHARDSDPAGIGGHPPLSPAAAAGGR